MIKSISSDIRQAVFERDNHTCQYCGRCGEGVEFEIDHIIPLSRGGNNDIRNLITACKECKRAKHNRLLNADELREIAEKINSSLEYLMSLANDGTRNTAKISVYIDDEMREGLSLLASLENVSITALVRNIIQEHLSRNAEDIDFMRRQKQKLRERRERRSNNDG